MNRQRAIELLESHVLTETLRKHCLASEAIMRHLARRFSQDEDQWGLAGLLHDLDFETTKEDMNRHGLVSTEILEKEGLDADSIHAIRAHNEEGTGVARETNFDFALSCAESITGLVVATALVMPEKKLAQVKPKSVIKRMKKKDFARSVSREDIRLCEKLGLTLPEFAELSVKAMQEISDTLGL